MIIREMTIEDIDQVIEIEKESFSTPWSRDAFINEIRDNVLAIYVVVEVDGKVVGYGGFWRILDEAHITNIAVKKECRGKGVGDVIIIGIIDYCEKNNIPNITLEVRESNISAQNLYRKHKFSSYGVRPGYYTDNGEDAVIMWRKMS